MSGGRGLWCRLFHRKRWHHYVVSYFGDDRDVILCGRCGQYDTPCWGRTNGTEAHITGGIER